MIRLLLSLFALAVALPLHAQLHNTTIPVTTTTDEFNQSPNTTCSLREAVQSSLIDADFGGCVASRPYDTALEVISVPPGTYNLTRTGAGPDDDVNGTDDLDLRSNLRIDGSGPANTIIRISGIQGRVMHVLNNATVTIQDVTLRDGNVPSGRAGGGLRSEPGTTTTLTNVTVGLNTADGNAGGILNRGTMTISNSAITNNQALNASSGGGGGGVYNDAGATLAVNNSLVQGNSVDGAPDAHVSGGGLFHGGFGLTLSGTVVDGNTVTGTFVEGGGLAKVGAGTLVISRSTFSGNLAQHGFGGLADGGGASVGPDDISTTLFFGNTAEGEGGGLHCDGCKVTSSLFDSNEARGAFSSGGGIDARDARIANTTIVGNRANSGGGVHLVASNASTASLVNSTVVDNSANVDGGGVAAAEIAGTGVIHIDGSTITGNTSNIDGSSGGAGGGLFIESGADVRLANTVLADNLENGIGNHDDCDGTLTSPTFNLVQQASGCTLSGGTGNLFNQTAGLAALADNGGPAVGAVNATVQRPMLTRLPLDSSVLIDAGDPTGCKDNAKNLFLALDQLGQDRTVDGPDADNTAECDIGAVESQPDRLFANGFELRNP